MEETLLTATDFINNETIENSSSNVSVINSKNINFTEGLHEGMFKAVEEIGYLMHIYYVPILIFCGGFGNIFSIVVFSRTKLSKLSSSYYLAALAVSDTCFLFGLFIQWLNIFDLHIYNRPFFCEFFTFFSNLACFCSAWFVVTFTVERFIAIMYPLRRHMLCTIRRAKITLSIVLLLGILHCVPFWLYSSPIFMDSFENFICDIRKDLTDNMTMLNYWDTIVVFAIPFLVIAVVNTLTCCMVWKIASKRRMLTMNYQTRYTKTSKKINEMSEERARNKNNNLMEENFSLGNEQRSETCTTTTHLNNSTPGQANVRNARLSAATQRNKALNSQIKITRMLMIVSTAFMALNLPSTLMRMKTFLETQSSANERTTIVLQYIFNLLFITHFGINFYLYCLSGQNFRKAVLSMIWPNYARKDTQVTSSLRLLSQYRRQNQPTSKVF